MGKVGVEKKGTPPVATVCAMRLPFSFIDSWWWHDLEYFSVKKHFSMTFVLHVRAAQCWVTRRFAQAFKYERCIRFLIGRNRSKWIHSNFIGFAWIRIGWEEESEQEWPNILSNRSDLNGLNQSGQVVLRTRQTSKFLVVSKRVNDLRLASRIVIWDYEYKRTIFREKSSLLIFFDSVSDGF